MTALTKAGDPRMGTTIEVLTTDEQWVPVKVVGRGTGVGQLSNTVVMIVIEWPDGYREPIYHYRDLEWRSADPNPKDES